MYEKPSNYRKMVQGSPNPSVTKFSITKCYNCNKYDYTAFYCLKLRDFAHNVALSK